MLQKLILCRSICKLSCYLSFVFFSNSITASPVKAQSIERLKINHTSNSIAQAVPPPAPQNVIPQPQPQQPAPAPPPEQLPAPDELLRRELEEPPAPAPPPSPRIPGEVPDTIIVKRFNIVGNTALSDKELSKVLAPFLNRPLSFAEILQAPEAITRLYIKRGYISSGALIPPQTQEEDGVVTIRVVEGSIEAINIQGTRRLDSNYIRARLPEKGKLLSESKLLEALQLLKLNPLLDNISAEISAGSRTDTSRITVRVTEAKTFSSQIILDNSRIPSVGSFKRGVQFNEANLLGLGDGLTLGYSNTAGSNGVDASYIVAVNSRNGTVGFYFGTISSSVIEDEFEFLDIDGSSRYYELTYRQPFFRTPTREFAVGLTAARRETNISSSVFEERGYPLSFLSPGADNEGRTRISALSFFQEWTRQNSRQVFAVRSSFNLGLSAFNATVNDNAPDSRFFSWRGQAQLIRLLAPETLLVLRTNVQLSPDELVAIEQFGLGGIDSVRGYRTDALLTDNVVFASAEVRLPIYRAGVGQTVLQLTPFIDIGTGWDNGGRSRRSFGFDDTNVLASFGLGLRLQLGNSLTARIDWGIPLTDVADNDGTLQEEGIYFSVVGNPF